MKNANKKLEKLSSLQSQVDKLTDELSCALHDHIGEDYFLNYDRGDGWLIVCEATSNQARIGWGFDFEALFKMSPEDAKNIIDNSVFN